MLFDYPRELRTNQALVVGMHAFLLNWVSPAPFSLVPVTAAWWRRSMCRNIPVRPGDSC